jgi:outer membrane protein, multidrug efflux system
VKTIGQILLKGLVLLVIVGCKVGPNYKRPTVNIPENYRSALAPDIASISSATSIADEHWVAMFQDPVLQRLVQEALVNNLDLRIAAERVLEAQAQVAITRAQQMPAVSAGGS